MTEKEPSKASKLRRFAVGYFPEKLLTNPVPVIIEVEDDQRIRLFSAAGDLLREWQLSDIKRLKSGQGTVTISIAHQTSVSLLVNRLNREEFLKSYGNKAVEMAGMKDFSLPNQEKDAIAFLSYLDSKGYQEKVVDGLDIFASLGITAVLCLTPVLLWFTPVVIIALIALVYVRNNYF